MSAPEYTDASRLSVDRKDTDRNQHNASPQVGVQQNPDPALDYKHEHKHEHLHHGGPAGKIIDDDVAYTKGTTDEPSTIPKADAMDDVLHRNHLKDGAHVHDSEKGAMSPSASTAETDPKT